LKLNRQTQKNRSEVIPSSQAQASFSNYILVVIQQVKKEKKLNKQTSR